MIVLLFKQIFGTDFCIGVLEWSSLFIPSMLNIRATLHDQGVFSVLYHTSDNFTSYQWISVLLI